MRTIKVSKESLAAFNHDKNVVGIKQKDYMDNLRLTINKSINVKKRFTTFDLLMRSSNTEQ